MTRKDYIAIANAISKADPSKAYGVVNDYDVFATFNVIIDALVEVMESDNPNFREADFRLACGYDYEIEEVG
jgi:hypothetical protein